MAKRIRYQLDSNNNWVSADYMRDKEGRYYRAGFLGGDPKTPTKGFVKSVDSDAVHLTLEATSHWKIKIKIKKALQKLGCSFEKEVRVKPDRASKDLQPSS